MAAYEIEITGLAVEEENKDAEDRHLEMSPAFWQMIEERRQRLTLPFEAVEATLFDESPA